MNTVLTRDKKSAVLSYNRPAVGLQSQSTAVLPDAALTN